MRRYLLIKDLFNMYHFAAHDWKTERLAPYDSFNGSYGYFLDLYTELSPEPPDTENVSARLDGISFLKTEQSEVE